MLGKVIYQILIFFQKFSCNKAVAKPLKFCGTYQKVN